MTFEQWFGPASRKHFQMDFASDNDGSTHTLTSYSLQDRSDMLPDQGRFKLKASCTLVVSDFPHRL